MQHLEHRDAGAATADVVAAKRQAVEERAAAASRAQREQRASRATTRKRLLKQLAAKEAAAQKAERRWVKPLADYRLSSTYGPRWGRRHAGTDMAAPTGRPVGAVTSGTVIFAGTQSGYGNKVEVRHWDGTVSYYAHLSTLSVRAGQRVRPGARLGRVGSTGRSTGPHLHLEIHPAAGGAVDARKWLRQRDVII